MKKAPKSAGQGNLKSSGGHSGAKIIQPLDDPEGSPFPTLTPTPFPTPTPTPLPSATPPPTSSPAPTAPPLPPTPTPTATLVPPTPPPTATPHPTPTPTQPQPTPTPTFPLTPAPTPTPVVTVTPTPTPTLTLAPEPTPTPTEAPPVTISFSVPNRIGITANGHNRSVIVVVYVSDPSVTDSIDLEATQNPDKISITFQSSDSDDGTASYLVVGLNASEDENDVVLQATADSAEPVTNSTSIIVPDQFGTLPGFHGNVTLQATPLDRNSVPPDYAAPVGEYLIAMQGDATTTIQILDQFNGNPGDLYAGADITESGLKINVQLQADGTYVDHCGASYRMTNATPGSASDPIAAQNAANLQTQFLARTDFHLQSIPATTNDVSVEVDGFSIGAFSRTKSLTLAGQTPPNLAAQLDVTDVNE